MKRLFFFISVVMIAVFGITLLTGIQYAQAADKVYRLKIQSAYPRGDLSMELLKEFAKSANKRSKGRITIQVFADPELVPAEQLFEATQKNNKHKDRNILVFMLLLFAGFSADEVASRFDIDVSSKRISNLVTDMKKLVMRCLQKRI